MGSSQGCASAFDAARERGPALCRFLAGMDPVVHEPLRFTSLRQPTLLVYDTEDAGHPVSVGRVLRRVLPGCHYYEYARSKDPFWCGSNLCRALLDLFSKHDTKPFASGEEATTAPKVVTGGRVLAWMAPYGREWERNDGWPPVEEAAEEQQARCEQEAAKRARCGADLFADDDEREEESESDEARVARLSAEVAQTACDVCGREADPASRVRLSPCRHLLCAYCCCWSLGVNRNHCPVARCPLECVVSVEGHVPKLPRAPAGESRFVLEFGNTASRVDDAGRHAVTAFVACAGSCLIRWVAFDINPSYPKSAVRVQSHPFELSRTMADAFPCDMLVEWRADLHWPQLRIGYTIQHAVPSFRRRLLVRVMPDTRRATRQAPVRYLWSDRDLGQPTVSWVALPV
eukprot:TRINITY_DN1988_c0_g1_i1.p1 TRINITY_DN1988_c0_g1~~TRINITY_DN1988_c0_g1_i1.p1  ORF type:complete len:403 (-),score=74.64 TRINITY_DN1988_c0_g1_i1:32-1240(-)